MRSPETAIPFTADVSISESLAPAELTIEARGAAAGIKQGGVLETIVDFVSAANTGAFCGAGAPPMQSHMEIIAEDDSELLIRRRCKIRGIDPGAFRVLLNMMVQAHIRGVPLAHVRLVSGTRFEKCLNLKGAWTAPYPGRVRQCPFPLLIDEFFFENKNPVIRWKFLREVQDREFEDVERLLEVWDRVLMRGGYVDDIRKMRALPMGPGETYLLTPRTVEHGLSGFDASEAAFDGLINLAVRVHFTLLETVALEFE